MKYPIHKFLYKFGLDSGPLNENWRLPKYIKKTRNIGDL